MTGATPCRGRLRPGLVEWIVDTASLGGTPFADPYVPFVCGECGRTSHVPYRFVVMPPAREGCCVAA